MAPTGQSPVGRKPWSLPLVPSTSTQLSDLAAGLPTNEVNEGGAAR